ncbi:MAG: hypothetical protein ABSE64_04150 [Vulcanimicrobiaceae bacterium]|jgi:hypothetical protein
MSSFVKLEWLDPYREFASRLRLSRRAMTRSYDEAFRAFEHCHELLKEERWSEYSGAPLDWFLAEATGEHRELVQPEEIPDYHYEAQVENVLADHQASSVILFADDTLQTFARGLLGKKHKTLDPYGPRYEDVRSRSNPVALSTLLRAATNAIRHLSEWDNPKFPFPYPTLDACQDGRCPFHKAISNIDVIQRAFGIGLYERIRDVVSMRVLIRVDGGFGSDPGPSYQSFEGAVRDAATQIAERAGADARDRLSRVLANGT